MSDPDDKPGLCPVAITGLSVSGLSRSSLRSLLQQVLHAEGCPPSFEVSVVLASDDKIAALHQQYMNIAGPTDVLSFPQDDPHEPAPDEPLLGDVVVSVDTAREQARDHGILLAQEVSLLAVHGVLHLMGHEDGSAEAASRMRALEMRYVPEAFPDESSAAEAAR